MSKSNSSGLQERNACRESKEKERWALLCLADFDLWQPVFDFDFSILISQHAQIRTFVKMEENHGGELSEDNVRKKRDTELLLV